MSSVCDGTISLTADASPLRVSSSQPGFEVERNDAAILLTALDTGSDLPLSVVLWAMRSVQGTETLREGLWTLSVANVYPSCGRGVEVVDQNNKITLSVHTEVITNIFGLHLTMLGKENQERRHPCEIRLKTGSYESHNLQ